MTDFIDYFCDRCGNHLSSPTFFIGTVKICRHCGNRTIIPRTSVVYTKRVEATPSDHANGNTPVQSPPVRDGHFYAEVLEIKSLITPEVVKKAYKCQLLRYHPDRVQHLGREFSEIANLKTKLINEAYDYFQRIGQA